MRRIIGDDDGCLVGKAGTNLGASTASQHSDIAGDVDEFLLGDEVHESSLHGSDPCVLLRFDARQNPITAQHTSEFLTLVVYQQQTILSVSVGWAIAARVNVCCR